MRTTIYLIRSAESIANIDDILGENDDYEITDHGIKTINILTDYFTDKKIFRIYSSKSTMCLKTVEKLADKLNIAVDIEEKLREKYFGILDGKKWDEIVSIEPGLKKFRKKKIEILGIKNQESTKDVEDRMYDVMRKIAKENLGQIVLVVSHGVAIETFLRLVVGVPYSEDKEKYFQKNGAINEIIFDEDLDLFEVRKCSQIIF